MTRWTKVQTGMTRGRLLREYPGATKVDASRKKGKAEGEYGYWGKKNRAGHRVLLPRTEGVPFGEGATRPRKGSEAAWRGQTSASDQKRRGDFIVYRYGKRARRYHLEDLRGKVKISDTHVIEDGVARNK